MTRKVLVIGLSSERRAMIAAELASLDKVLDSILIPREETPLDIGAHPSFMEREPPNPGVQCHHCQKYVRGGRRGTTCPFCHCIIRGMMRHGKRNVKRKRRKR